MKNPFLIQPKSFLSKVYSGSIWKIDTNARELYLTFDDGPVPGLTEFVLDELDKYKAKATFFCVGDNIRKHPSVFERIIANGHTAGSHTMHHVKGFKTPLNQYLQEVRACSDLTGNKLFRPPYGQLTPAQFRALKKDGYTVAFWDVISYDYEQIPEEQCLCNVLENSGPGSIVLFHDNVKAEKNLRYTLPLFLKHFANLHFEFKPLPTK